MRKSRLELEIEQIVLPGCVKALSIVFKKTFGTFPFTTKNSWSGTYRTLPQRQAINQTVDMWIQEQTQHLNK